jgi:hypothetical protein
MCDQFSIRAAGYDISKRASAVYPELPSGFGGHEENNVEVVLIVNWGLMFELNFH